MQFKTKQPRWRRPGTDFSVPLSGSVDSRTMIECDGAPYIREDRQIDLIESGTVLGAVQFKAGQRSFPAMYGHKLGFIGETVDAKRSGDGSAWVILLRVLDENGEYVTIDDQRVEFWFLEPNLVKLDGVGVVSITPGQSINANDVLRADHTRKLVGFRQLHRIRRKDEIRQGQHGPERPDENDDEVLCEQRRDVPEQVWRIVNQYAEMPLTVEDPEWTLKLRAVGLIFAWLRQECPRRNVKNEDGTVTVEPYVIQ